MICICKSSAMTLHNKLFLLARCLAHRHLIEEILRAFDVAQPGLGIEGPDASVQEVGLHSGEFSKQYASAETWWMSSVDY